MNALTGAVHGSLVFLTSYCMRVFFKVLGLYETVSSNSLSPHTFHSLLHTYIHTHTYMYLFILEKYLENYFKSKALLSLFLTVAILSNSIEHFTIKKTILSIKNVYNISIFPTYRYIFSFSS